MRHFLACLAIPLFLAGFALAAEPVPLSDAQMDAAIAGFDDVPGAAINNLLAALSPTPAPASTFTVFSCCCDCNLGPPPPASPPPTPTAQFSNILSTYSLSFH